MVLLLTGPPCMDKMAGANNAECIKVRFAQQVCYCFNWKFLVSGFKILSCTYMESTLIFQSFYQYLKVGHLYYIMEVKVNTVCTMISI